MLIYALQSFTATDGTVCAAKSTYTLNEQAANNAIMRGQAQRAETPGYFEPSADGVDVSSLQSQMASGGNVYLDESGIFSTNSTLIAKSNTKLTLGKDTRIKQADGTHLRMLSNTNETSATQTVTIAAAVSAQTEEYFATVTFPLAHGMSAGGFVLLKGDTSNQYNGVWEIYDAPTSLTLRFLLGKGSAAPTSGTGTITAAAADGNIEVVGGTWDYNAQGQSTTSGYTAHAITMNKVLRPRISDTTFRDVRKYSVMIGNAQEPIVSNIHADTDSDGTHFIGPIHKGLVEKVSGTFGDDVVIAMNIEPTGYTAQMITGGDMGGDVRGFTARDIKVQRSAGSVVAIYPTNGYVMQDVHINNIGASTGARRAVTIENVIDANTKTVEDVSISGIDGVYTDSIVNVAGASGGVLTVKRLYVSDVYPDSAYPQAMTTNGSFKFSYAVVNDFVLDGYYPTFDVTGAEYGVYFGDSSSHADKLTIKNFRLLSSGSGSSFKLVAVTGGTFKTISISDGVVAGTGSLIDISGIVGTPSIFIDRVVLDGGQNFVGGTASTANIYCSDCAVLSGTIAFNFYATSGSGTINLYVKNLKHALTDIIANLNKTYQTVNLYGDATAKTNIMNLGTAANQQAVHNGATSSATGTISGTSLTVTGVTGVLAVGQVITGVGVTAGTTITAVVTPGSAYTVSASQTVGPVAMTFAAGTIDSGAMCVCDPAGVWRQMSDPVNKHYP